MKRLLCLNLIIVLALAGMMLMPGCTPEIPKPDLVPVNPDNWADFCGGNDSGKRIIGDSGLQIKNQGAAAAGPSTLEVDLGQYGQILGPVPSLLAGETTTISVQIPSACFDPDCDFEITVDSAGVIDESNELNNTQKGSCMG